MLNLAVKSKLQLEHYLLQKCWIQVRIFYYILRYFDRNMLYESFRRKSGWRFTAGVEFLETSYSSSYVYFTKHLWKYKKYANLYSAFFKLIVFQLEFWLHG